MCYGVRKSDSAYASDGTLYGAVPERKLWKPIKMSTLPFIFQCCTLTMKSSLLIAIGTLVVTSIITKDIYAKEVTAISECPRLTARPSGPTNVTDLRADDIKVVGALGDRCLSRLYQDT